MTPETDFTPQTRSAGRGGRSAGPRSGASMPLPWRIALGALALVMAGVGYWWLVQRVEVEKSELLVLVRRVGADLPPEAQGQFILYPELLTKLGAVSNGQPDPTRYKGIVFQPLTEGRYFYDPFLWERIKVPATIIAPDEMGILVRKYGRDLPEGKTVASAPDERGPVAEILVPGRYNINPFAFAVKRVKPVQIPNGHVGVQTLLAGTEPANPNTYVVQRGERGVQPDVLPPGLYYNNPYVRRIDVIDARSHTIDLHGSDAMHFPSNDSFEILVDCTVEYALRPDRAPYVMVAIGDHDDIKDKLILPQAKSLCRIEGSKLLARDFISGDTRETFQEKVFEGLRHQCYEQGIEIRATLIRKIVPPAEIAEPISDRQVAGQQIKQYEFEMKVADSEARLVEQQEMQKQNQAVGQANRQVVSLTTEAEQRKAVALTEARQRLEVAKLQLEAARQTAEAVLSRGRADAEVRLLQFEAEAKPLRAAVTAFGDGETYAQFFFYEKLAPAVRSVLASTDGPFADIFRALSTSKTTPREPERRSPGDMSRNGGGE